MKLAQQLRQWWQVQTGNDDNPFEGDAPAWGVSLLVHLTLLIVIAYIPLVGAPDDMRLTTVSTPPEELLEAKLELPQEFEISDQSFEEIGANSVGGIESAMSLAPLLADISQVPVHNDFVPTDVGTIEVNNEIEIPTGFTRHENLVVRGSAGVGTTGAVGAVDRLTKEILRSLEERKTLVVWMFDQSPSMIRQRREVVERFDRIYQELGVIEASGNAAFKKHDNQPLLTSIISFGSSVNLVTPRPTDSLVEIKAAIGNIPPDDSGQEKVFSAVYMAAKEFSSLRLPDPTTRQPKRNVLLIAFTDEVGDDVDGLDETVKICRRHEIPAYVVGVPAPFGRKDTQVKWVDPDPKFDQSPQWGVVYQGPESFLPEMVKVGFSSTQGDVEAMDSGFGPYALTRLCVETGGIYFAVHPNRNVTRDVGRGETDAFSAHLTKFFDPTVMRRYKPDYCSKNEYLARLKENASRLALVQAAEMSAVDQMKSPRRRFVKRDEGQLSNDLSEAQQESARLEPKISAVYEVLKKGEADREKEATPRWQVGYDLAMGRILAAKVRTEAYNAMLAEAKRGLKFQDPKNNVWVLVSSSKVGGGSNYEKLAKQADMYLKRVVAEHAGTPWALLAERELNDPLGWQWTEDYVDLNPPPRPNPNNNNNPPPMPVDNIRMLPKPPVRPVPKNL